MKGINTVRRRYFGRFFTALLFTVLALCACATRGATSAEEYFSIGMAYFDLGQAAKDESSRSRYFSDAEKWLNRAKSANKTMTASEYNLGRIAFETKRYDAAAVYFEAVLKKDPNNVLALKAAAYTRIKTGEIDLAEKHYEKLLKLVPESADDGYNHALVLYAMERYDNAEKVLSSYPFALQDSNDMMLLYARSQKAQNKVEAIDSYAKLLDGSSDAKARYEYAQVLERHEMYARALEEYRKTLTEADKAGSGIKQSELRFALARLLLVADSESEEGIGELETAVKAGFNDIEAVEELQKNENISAANRSKLETIINNMQRNVDKNQPAVSDVSEDENEPVTETAPQDDSV
ncbi:MAG: tetratricopeptide repeat protein [Treponema sp.]|jgi:tetratricopeptide (TPR) repeat protein|nr:tetratricopeptide repeat protein [Treponema sp.]